MISQSVSRLSERSATILTDIECLDCKLMTLLLSCGDLLLFFVLCAKKPKHVLMRSTVRLKNHRFFSYLIWDCRSVDV